MTYFNKLKYRTVARLPLDLQKYSHFYGELIGEIYMDVTMAQGIQLQKEIGHLKGYEFQFSGDSCRITYRCTDIADLELSAIQQRCLQVNVEPPVEYLVYRERISQIKALERDFENSNYWKN